MWQKNSSKKPAPWQKRPAKKALWLQSKNQPTSRERTRTEKKHRGDEYLRLRKFFLAKNPACACYEQLADIEVRCGRNATQVHHTRGRIGSMLNRIEYWLPVCGTAHKWIDHHPNVARQFGWLPEKGGYNSPKK
jgi:hypothetical protein